MSDLKRSSGAVIGFGDADLITNAAALMACYEKCRCEFDAMKPYEHLVDLNLEESRLVLSGDWKIKTDRRGLPRNREGIGNTYVSVAACFLFADQFMRTGGFDERFVGWGGEDDAMTSKLLRLGKSSGMARNQIAYHLWHKRSMASRYLHPITNGILTARDGTPPATCKL